MKKLILPFLLSLFLICSCSNDINLSGTAIHLVSVAITYKHDESATTLETTVNDQSDFVNQITYLADASYVAVHPYTFTENESGELLLTTNPDDKTDYGEDSQQLLDFIRNIPVTSENDLVIFYFSGHGGIDSDGSTLCLNPTDSDDDVHASALINTLKSVKGKKWVVLDCCYSGGAVSGNSLSQGFEYESVWAENEKRNLDYYTRTNVFKGIGDAFSLSVSSAEIGNNDIWVLSASLKNQLSSSYGDYGEFTEALLTVLGSKITDSDEETATPGLPSQKTITFYDTYERTVEKLKEILPQHDSKWNNQTPTASMTPVDLILFQL